MTVNRSLSSVSTGNEGMLYVSVWLKESRWSRDVNITLLKRAQEHEGYWVLGTYLKYWHSLYLCICPTLNLVSCLLKQFTQNSSSLYAIVDHWHSKSHHFQGTGLIFVCTVISSLLHFMCLFHITHPPLPSSSFAPAFSRSVFLLFPLSS